MYCYAILPEEELLIVRFVGHVSDAKQLEARHQTRQDPRYKLVERILVDLSELTKSSVTGSNMATQSLTLNAENQGRAAPMQYAIYSPQDSFGFSMARMFQNATGMAPNIDVQVFDDPTEACKWLGLLRRPEVYLQEPAFAQMQ